VVRKDGAETRKDRIEQCAQHVQSQLYKNNGNPISLSRTVAALAFDTGLSKPKVVEYLELLAETGQFEINLQDDKIRKCQV
jgi:hypothetical protein